MAIIPTGNKFKKLENFELTASWGFKELQATQGIWLRTCAWQKRKMHWVWNLETLSLSSIYVPPPLPYSGYSSGSYLWTTFISTHQKSVQGVRKKGETRLRHYILDAVRREMQSISLPLWLAFVGWHLASTLYSNCLGKGIWQNIKGNSSMWLASLTAPRMFLSVGRSALFKNNNSLNLTGRYLHFIPSYKILPFLC